MAGVVGIGLKQLPGDGDVAGDSGRLIRTQEARVITRYTCRHEVVGGEELQHLGYRVFVKRQGKGCRARRSGEGQLVPVQL